MVVRRVADNATKVKFITIGLIIRVRVYENTVYLNNNAKHIPQIFVMKRAYIEGV